MSTAEITLKDIAKAVGKSVATVSKALHNHTDIAPQTRAHIQEIANELGYIPNITAQRLQKQRTDALGLILPVLSARQADPFFVELLSGVADQAANNGFDLLVSTRSSGTQEQLAYQRLVGQRRVDGVIVAQPRHEDWRIDFLTKQLLPFVVIGYHQPTLNYPGIWVDVHHGLEQVITHLTEQRRTQLAFILPPANLRFNQAYQEALNALTNTHVNAPTLLEATELTQKAGYQITQRLLTATPVPDAIIACHDLVAMGAITAVQDQGFEVGHDVVVIGFGDIRLTEHTQPPLTTLHQPTFNMGQQACKMLLTMIAEQPLPAPQIIIEPWLVVRQSSNLALWL